MSKKYIDLYEKITYPRTTTNDYRRGVIDTLGFLDRNPDQVPGRTITESRLREIELLKRKVHNWTERRTIQSVGVEIIPDPEPTNAEKLREILNEVWTPAQDARTFAEWLDSNGVKAPEADND